MQEEGIRNSNKWTGPVGMNIGGVLYIDMSTDELLESNIDQLSESIKKFTNKKITQTTSMSSKNNANSKENAKNDFVKLEELDYETAIALLVYLGCLKNVESFIAKNYNKEDFDGKLLSLINNEMEFIDHLGLQYLNLNSLIVRKIFSDIQTIKNNGIEEKSLQQINKLRKEAAAKAKVINIQTAKYMHLYLFSFL